MITTPDLQHLKALALAATQDDWQMIDLGSQYGLRVRSGYQAFFPIHRSNSFVEAEGRASAAFFGALTPPVALALIAQLEAKPAAPAAAPLQQGEDLPPLPEPRAIRAGLSFPKVYAFAYTADQMREYASLARTAAPSEGQAIPTWRERAEAGDQEALTANGCLKLAEAEISDLRAVHARKTDPIEWPPKETDMSKRLRARAASPYVSATSEISELLRAAADEIDRYYGGMVNWKKCAEAKDATIADLRAALANTRAAAPAAEGATKRDMKQLADMILTDPDGGSMVISSDISIEHDNSMRFKVTNPKTGRRFGVVLGLAELSPSFDATKEGVGDAPKPITTCQAARDGDCSHAQCPQLRDGEPNKSGRHCPLDNTEDE